jgi:ferrous iron transport protein A
MILFFVQSMKGTCATPRVLASFQPGESGIVISVATSELSPKLAEMGIYAGKSVTVLFRAPFGGPIAVDIDGYTLSMRTDEAGLVVVDPAVS